MRKKSPLFLFSSFLFLLAVTSISVFSVVKSSKPPHSVVNEKRAAAVVNKLASKGIVSDAQIQIPIPIHTSNKQTPTNNSIHGHSKPKGTAPRTALDKSNINLASETIDLNNQCSKNAPVRKFTITAINVDMVYNKFGDHQPDSKIYALKEDVSKIKKAVKENPGKPVKEVQPLTIRANKGDCVEVTFSNQLTEKTSIHIDGVGYDVQTSDGTEVGFNRNSTAAPNTEIIYRWNTEEEGTFFFYNGADLTFYTDPTGGKGTMGDGLFGALIVEPIGAKWTDPQTGEELASGLYANIELPDQPDFREFALFFHDGVNAVAGNQSSEVPPKNENEGEEQEDPHEAVEDPNEALEKELYAVNYRAEPLDERMENSLTEDGKDPTMFYSSWVYGDPATPITPAYVGDPVKFRVIGANQEENHVFHLHGHRWKSDSKKTNTVDSETLNIGSSQTAELTNDAGYIQNGKGAPGDYLWHCHLFPHYLQGMWGLLRVFDKLQPELLPLKDRETPSQPSVENPGFPNYIPGEQGKRAPKPPDPELRPATEKEKEALGALVPGAPNFDRCPKTAPVRKYNVVGIQTDIVYNNEGDHDKEGRMFVLAEDEAKILNGTLRPRPLVIRANEGDCVEVTLENHLINATEPNALSMHIHYVGFDPLGSDGTAVGWNYNQSTEPGEKIRYRWYADEEGNIFFHDHMSAGEKGFHGTFGALIVEPKGSKWIHPKTGLEMKSGTEAMIVIPGKADFREQVLVYHDFARMWDKNGNLLPLESDPANTHKAHGYAAVNYSNAPFFRRNSADPAYVFSSWVHGDPQTPIIESYPNDPIKIRLIQGAHETQHNFNLHGLNWKKESGQQDSELTSTQTIGMSEQFTMDIQPNPVGIRQRDYLWSSQTIEDLWSGLWGFVRVWGEQNTNLKKLPDRVEVKQKIDTNRLKKMKKEGTKPPKAIAKGNICPDTAKIKSFDVTAFMKDIVYNKAGDHDPYGLMFALTKDVTAIKKGTKPTEPLVIRANEGECIQIRLRNNLPFNPPENKNDPDLLMAKQVDWKNSNRVSLHPQMVQYDVQGSDGATIGFNYDQTIGPGETIIYEWYADKEHGGTILYDYGDIRSHRLHGGYGALIIEPKDAFYRNPKTGESIMSGALADIIVPGKPDFREQALMFSDGLYTIGKDGSPPTPGQVDPITGELLDLEDHGEKGINYSSEPFKYRLAENSDKSLIFSSVVHGDPSTPIPEAYMGDPIRLRVMQTADRSRGSVFTLHSNKWRYQWTDPNSKVVGSQGSLTPGDSLDIIPIQKEGFFNPAGDYLYREMKLRRYLEGGLWGILRVHDQPKNQLLSLPDRLPKAPINVRKGTKANSIIWDVLESKNLVGFNIYRKLIPENTFKKVNKEMNRSGSFTEEEVLPFSTYVYSVRSVDKFGNESLNSKEIIVDVSGGKNTTGQKEEIVQAGPSGSKVLKGFQENVEIKTEEVQRIEGSFQISKIELDKLGRELSGFIKPVEERDKAF
ncbi:multicopper oxidase domain-containing protein [Bacillus sp. X1(2014)]|uniref:multicopper oxidase domain-containing protein n=1 Tax=Bacillus sp. X1(2014) TaxID=1565991 RepID=UPI0011A9C598|nr:multicopper oxidase domain-containing protein [Bacillus sp. X1(2014)]